MALVHRNPLYLLSYPTATKDKSLKKQKKIGEQFHSAFWTASCPQSLIVLCCVCAYRRIIQVLRRISDPTKPTRSSLTVRPHEVGPAWVLSLLAQMPHLSSASPAKPFQYISQRSQASFQLISMTTANNEKQTSKT